MLPFSRQTRLADGTSILIRDVRPEDAPLLRLGFAHLSPEGRYFRFLSQVENLSDAQISNFTARSDADHIAIGALADGTDPAAIARHIRLPTRPDRAEFAITVVDAYQGKGLGALMIGMLASCVRAQRIKVFDGLVHPENLAMRRIVSGLNGTQRFESHSDLAVTIPLHADPANYPATNAGDAMRHAAALCADPA